jgi:signal transduction histidine kinase/ActR/RegA family two-component response regulator
MKNAPLPSNESARLRALHEYRILDTIPEAEYDHITRIASEICHTPASLINLIDQDRQWSKSKFGCAGAEVPRAISFCAHAILQPQELLVVPDACQDERFADNPMTVGQPPVRFYAGVPLVSSEGFPVGTLCVFDHEPNQLTEGQEAALRALADQTVSHFELRKKTAELEESQRQLRAINAELRAATERAEAIAEAKANFLSIMSHEIRTPIHTILGYTGILLEDPRPDQEAALRTLQFSGQTLLSLLNDILDFSKLDSGKVVLEAIPFNPGELIDQIVATHSPQARAKINRLRTHLDPALPPALLGDPVRLTQVLNNLVSNAVKFTTHGDVTLDVRVLATDAATTTVRFRVADTGVGIPAEAQERIFEDFSQASAATTRKFGGTGLGLSITRKLLQLFGSQIHLESKVGQGSTFTFAIQFRNTDVASTPRPDAPTIDFNGFRVLAVDDNAVNLKLIGHHLAKKGITADLFTSPLDALHATEVKTYDLLFLDLQMPEMSGFELCVAIRQHNLTVPIIALSADASPETIASVLRLGMNGFVAKPYTLDKMQEVLAQYLHSEVRQPVLV